MNRVGASLRYAAGLRAFARETLGPVEARRMLERQLARREDSFLDLIERGVYGSAVRTGSSCSARGMSWPTCAGS